MDTTKIGSDPVKDAVRLKKGLDVDLRCAGVVLHLSREDDVIIDRICEKLGGAVQRESIVSDLKIASALVDFMVQTDAVKDAVTEVMVEMLANAEAMGKAKEALRS